jgi:transposase
VNKEEQLASASEKARKAVEYRNKLLIIRVAEAEIPELHDTGEITITALAKQYGISYPTVKRILRDAGRQDTRFRKLNDDERAEVAALIRQGRDHDHIAATYQISRNTVRRIGLQSGALKPGRRKARRSDEDYRLIAEFDQEARARFNGAGLYNLGMGLRQWQRRRGAQVEALKHANQTVLEPSEPLPVDEVPDTREEPEWPAAEQGELPPAYDFDEDVAWAEEEEAPEPSPATAPPDLVLPVPEPATEKPNWQF